MNGGRIPSVSFAEMGEALAQGEPVFDVREPAEYAAGHVTGTRSLPSTQLQQRIYELPRDRRVFLVCASGARSAQAVGWLRAIGYDAVNVLGGLREWQPG